MATPHHPEHRNRGEPELRLTPGSGVGDLLRAARRRAGLSLEDLAQRVGCGRSHLSQIENAKREASEDLLGRLEEGLGLPAGVLVEAAGLSRAPEVLQRKVSRMQEQTAAARRLAEILRASGVAEDGTIRGSLDLAHKSGELRRLVSAITPEAGPPDTAPQSAKADTDRPAPSPRPGGAPGAAPPAPGPSGELSIERAMPRVVPLINRVAAGYPAEFTDLGYPARIADEYIRTLDVDDTDAFAARVVGDSMAPEYIEGDVVVFSPAAPATSGDDCFARLEPDHESTFKRVFFEKNTQGDDVVRLQPLNPAYPARIVPREQVAGLYPAVSVQRRVGRMRGG